MPMMQHDLFADEPSAASNAPRGRFEATPEFIAGIRAELEATLRMAREAATLPWPDLTQTTLAELRFESLTGWLPKEEGQALRVAFEAEMTRLYDAEDARREAASADA